MGGVSAAPSLASWRGGDSERACVMCVLVRGRGPSLTRGRREAALREPPWWPGPSCTVELARSTPHTPPTQASSPHSVIPPLLPIPRRLCFKRLDSRFQPHTPADLWKASSGRAVDFIPSPQPGDPKKESKQWIDQAVRVAGDQSNSSSSSPSSSSSSSSSSAHPPYTPFPIHLTQGYHRPWRCPRMTSRI
jgi:hypothetical protein